jgi:hypothetical protein
MVLHTPMPDERYQIGDFTLETVRNRQEMRVVTAMRDLLPTAEDFCGCRLCVEDVYAIALNSLPPHYVQSGALLLRKPPPSDDDIARAVQDALDKVRVRPNHPG